MEIIQIAFDFFLFFLMLQELIRLPLIFHPLLCLPHADFKSSYFAFREPHVHLQLDTEAPESQPMFLLAHPNSLHTLILSSVTLSLESDKSFLEVAVPDSKVKGITESS